MEMIEQHFRICSVASSTI